MVHQYAMIECFIAIVQILQNDIFLDVRILSADGIQVSADLDVHVGATGWEEAAEAETVAFAGFEGCSLVEEGVG